MNASLDLGPDILTSLQGLLLKFRSDVVAAAGDSNKIYFMASYSSWHGTAQFDDMEMEEKFRVKSVCKVSSVLKKTTAAMPDLDKIILRASTQGSLKQLIRSTALVMRVFLADCRLNTDSVATRTDTSDRMLNKIDDQVWQRTKIGWEEFHEIGA